MGGSPPTTVMPAPVAPTVYQSVIPKESFAHTADYLARIQKQTQTAQDTLYSQAGTPAQLRAQNAGVDMQAAGTYLASLPTGDKYTRATSGVENKFAPAQQAASERFSESQKTYAEALSRANDKPAPVAQERPSWAEGAGYDTPAPAPAPAPASNPMAGYHVVAEQTGYGRDSKTNYVLKPDKPTTSPFLSRFT